MKILLLSLIVLSLSCSRQFRDETIVMGEGEQHNSKIESDQGLGANNPYLGYDFLTGKWRLSHDGVTVSEMLNSDELANNYVSLNGDQDIGGIKTFSGQLFVSGDPSRPQPNKTQIEIDALTGMTRGDQVFNTDSGKLQVWNGSNWQDFSGEGAGGSGVPVMSVGSLITSNGSANGELFVGVTDGHVLTVNSGATDGTGLEWLPAGAGGGFPFANKGSLVSYTGSVSTEFNACANGEILVWNSATLSGLECGNKTSDTNAGTQCDTGEVLDGDGACIATSTITPNTNAETICADGEYLDGSGACIANIASSGVSSVGPLYFEFGNSFATYNAKTGEIYFPLSTSSVYNHRSGLSVEQGNYYVEAEVGPSVGTYIFGVQEQGVSGCNTVGACLAVFAHSTYQSGGTLWYNESGITADTGITVNIGDKIRITYDGTNIVYSRNGITFRTVAHTPTYPLGLGIALNGQLSSPTRSDFVKHVLAKESGILAAIDTTNACKNGSYLKSNGECTATGYITGNDTLGSLSYSGALSNGTYPSVSSWQTNVAGSNTLFHKYTGDKGVIYEMLSGYVEISATIAAAGDYYYRITPSVLRDNVASATGIWHYDYFTVSAGDTGVQATRYIPCKNFNIYGNGNVNRDEVDYKISLVVSAGITSVTWRPVGCLYTVKQL